MIDEKEAWRRADRLAVQLVRIPWQFHRDRRKAIAESVTGLDVDDASEVVIAALYTLADSMQVTMQTIAQYTGGLHEYEVRIKAMADEKDRWLTEQSFRDIVDDLDFPHQS